MTDTADSDDGALHRFYAFLERRAAAGRPPFDLERLEQVRAAIAAYEDDQL